MLGERLYGEVLYGEDRQDERVYTLPERYTDLEKYVPPFVVDIGEMDAIYRAQGYEVGRAHALMDSLFEQSIPHLAWWDLEHWEAMLDIPPGESVSDETRRALIMERLAGAETMTAARIVQLALRITGEEVVVQETPAEYRFTVMFIGAYGIPNHIKLLKRIIEELKPAHLQCDYTYRYVIWDELADRTWTELEAYTWDGLRISTVIPFVSWESLADAMPSWRSLKLESWNTTTKLKEAMQ